MKKMIFAGSFAAAIFSLAVSCTQQDKNSSYTSGGAISKDSLIKRGEYLVSVSGCHDCHSPKKVGPMGPEPDPSLLLSGHPAKMPLGKIDTSLLKDWVFFNHMNTAIVGPWGVSFSANITSDESGVGNWSEEQFFKAIRQGKYKGMDEGRMLLPPMPWPAYAKMKDEDLKAIFTYLKSTKPVENVVPSPIPPTELGKVTGMIPRRLH